METTNKDIAIMTMFISHTILAQVPRTDQTKITAKLLSQLKKYNKNFDDTQKVKHDALLDIASNGWDTARTKMLKNKDADGYSMNLVVSLVALYQMKENVGYPKLGYTEKTMISAVNSIIANASKSKHTAPPEVIENDTSQMMEYFAEAIGIKQSTKLSTIARKVKDNHIISNTLSDKYL